MFPSTRASTALPWLRETASPGTILTSELSWRAFAKSRCRTIRRPTAQKAPSSKDTILDCFLQITSFHGKSYHESDLIGPSSESTLYDDRARCPGLPSISVSRRRRQHSPQIFGNYRRITGRESAKRGFLLTIILCRSRSQ
jgi:hypothetical protein